MKITLFFICLLLPSISFAQPLAPQTKKVEALTALEKEKKTK